MDTSRVRWEYVLLAVLLIGLFWLRMALATSVPTLDYGAYSTVREVDHILATGQPLRDDPLSVTGKERLGSPIFTYLLAVLVWFTPLAYKIFPNLCMVLLLIPIYALVRHLTGSPLAAFAGTILAGSGPFVFGAYLNDPSPVPLAALLFLSILAMLHNPDKYLYPIVALTLFLTFIHPLVLLLVLSLIVIIALLRLEGFKIDVRISELFLFTLFLSVWFHIIVYKRAFAADGLRVIWKNLPTSYAGAAFGNVTFITVLYGLGVIAFLFGVLGAYHALFERRARISLSIVGAIIAAAACLFLRMLELRLGLMMLTLLLSVMAAYGLHLSAAYLARTKAPFLRYPIGIFLFLLFLLTAILPGLANANEQLKNAPTPNDLADYRMVGDLLPNDAVILTTLREAEAFQYAAQRTTLTDDDFILVRSGDELVSDIDAVYTARFVSSIVGRAQKLDITHILFSEDARRAYQRDTFAISNSSCLRSSVVGSGSILYTIDCGDVAR